MRGKGDRGRMLTRGRTERRQEVKENEGGLLKTGKSKGDDGGGQEKRNEKGNKGL